MASRPAVVFVLGPPGAGKGTQSANIVEHFGFEHLSAGDLLRAERNTESETAELINSYIKEGQIVPVAITVGLIKKAMETSSKTKFLVDGFPRNKDNYDGWFEVMKDAADVKFTLFLDCPEAVCTERILERGKSSGRVDDNEESLRKRHQTYETQTRPILDVFREQGLSRQVDASMAPAAVWEKVKALFEAENLA